MLLLQPQQRLQSDPLQGFHRVRSRIGDLELDCPRAQQQLDELARAATAAGLLDRTWASQEPSPPASQPALAPQVLCSSSSLCGLGEIAWLLIVRLQCWEHQLGVHARAQQPGDWIMGRMAGSLPVCML